MNRILALQGLTGSGVGTAAIGDSAQSVQCSSSTAKCSTQSAGCGGGGGTIAYAIAW